MDRHVPLFSGLPEHGIWTPLGLTRLQFLTILARGARPLPLRRRSDLAARSGEPLPPDHRQLRRHSAIRRGGALAKPSGPADAGDRRQRRTGGDQAGPDRGVAGGARNRGLRRLTPRLRLPVAHSATATIGKRGRWRGSSAGPTEPERAYGASAGERRLISDRCFGSAWHSRRSARRARR